MHVQHSNFDEAIRKNRPQNYVEGREENKYQVHCTHLMPTTGLPVPSSCFIFVKSQTGSNVDDFDHRVNIRLSETGVPVQVLCSCLCHIFYS